MKIPAIFEKSEFWKSF